MTISDTPRRVVVTGSGGISEATAALLLALGHRVHIISRSTADSALIRTGHASLTSSDADLSVDAAAHDAFGAAVESLGGIDGLVAVAGGSGRSLGDGPLDQLTSEALHRNVDLNLATTTNALREFVNASPHGDRRSAVLIGSTLARFPASPLFATHAYAAMKAGIEGLARAAAAHYARDGIAVNVVAPGLTRTPMAARAQGDPVVSEYARRRQPLTSDGFVEPEEVAAACEWLLRAPSVTGQVIYVDGGWSVSG